MDRAPFPGKGAASCCADEMGMGEWCLVIAKASEPKAEVAGQVGSYLETPV